MTVIGAAHAAFHNRVGWNGIRSGVRLVTVRRQGDRDQRLIGWHDNKRYPDNTGPDYSYSSAGRLKKRTWARIGTSSSRIVTTYTYGYESSQGHGDLVSVAYSNDPQSTPTVTHSYDRRGRDTTITVGTTSTASLTLNDLNQPLTETYSGAGSPLAGLAVTNGYDYLLRRTNLVLLSGSTILTDSTNSYDAASRLAIVGDNGANTATYSYLANSPLVSQISFKNGSTVRMTTTKQYDFINRLLSISSAPSASSAVSFSYSLNDANQRVTTRLAEGSYWVYLYDDLGQVTSGKKYFADGTPVPGQQFEYGFDDIGNRSSTKAGGDENGSNLRSANYSANNLNQYTSRDVPGALDIIGVALATSSVLVNNNSPYRHVEYFRYELPVSNGSAPVWQSVSVTASGQTSATGNIFIPLLNY